MITQPTQESLNRLPKWARDHIESISRQLASSQAQCERFSEEQKESPFYIDEWLSEPRIKRYVTATCNRVCVDHAGVHLEIYLPAEGDSQRLNGIELSYSNPQNMHGDIAIIPRSHGCIQLLSPENMR